MRQVFYDVVENMPRLSIGELARKGLLKAHSGVITIEPPQTFEDFFLKRPSVARLPFQINQEDGQAKELELHNEAGTWQQNITVIEIPNPFMSALHRFQCACSRNVLFMYFGKTPAAWGCRRCCNLTWRSTRITKEKPTPTPIIGRSEGGKLTHQSRTRYRGLFS